MSQVAADALVKEGDELFRAERFEEAADCFQRAVELLPHHALGWRGLGHSLLSLGKPHEAARAFDQAIGLRPDSATALWGGALAHADVGNKLIAQNYLRRTIALQPSWVTMALGTPQLAPFLLVSSRAADRLHERFGSFATQRFHHAEDRERVIEVGRIPRTPEPGITTFVTVGLSNAEWNEVERPRVELILASKRDIDACARILANLAFHLVETKFFPEPGTIVREVVAAVDAGALSKELPHVYVEPARGFRIELPLDEGPPAITLAQVVPISEAEYQRWREGGREALEKMLAERDILAF